MAAPAAGPWVLLLPGWPREPLETPRLQRAVKACSATGAGWLSLASNELLVFETGSAVAAQQAVLWLTGQNLLGNRNEPVLAAVFGPLRWFEGCIGANSGFSFHDVSYAGPTCAPVFSQRRLASQERPHSVAPFALPTPAPPTARPASAADTASLTPGAPMRGAVGTAQTAPVQVATAPHMPAPALAPHPSVPPPPPPLVVRLDAEEMAHRAELARKRERLAKKQREFVRVQELRELTEEEERLERKMQVLKSSMTPAAPPVLEPPVLEPPASLPPPSAVLQAGVEGSGAAWLPHATITADAAAEREVADAARGREARAQAERDDAAPLEKVEAEKARRAAQEAEAQREQERVQQEPERAEQARQARAREDEAREAKVREDEAREAKVREDEAREAKVREDEAREAKVREDEAREAKVREDETRVLKERTRECDPKRERKKERTRERDPDCERKKERTRERDPERERERERVRREDEEAPRERQRRSRAHDESSVHRLEQDDLQTRPRTETPSWDGVSREPSPGPSRQHERTRGGRDEYEYDSGRGGDGGRRSSDVRDENRSRAGHTRRNRDAGGSLEHSQYGDDANARDYDRHRALSPRSEHRVRSEESRRSPLYARSRSSRSRSPARRLSNQLRPALPPQAIVASSPRFLQHDVRDIAPFRTGRWEGEYDGPMEFVNSQDRERLPTAYFVTDLLPDSYQTQFVTPIGVRKYVHALVADCGDIERVIVRPAFATPGTGVDIIFKNGDAYDKLVEQKRHCRDVKTSWGVFVRPDAGQRFRHSSASAWYGGTGYEGPILARSDAAKHGPAMPGNSAQLLSTMPPTPLPSQPRPPNLPSKPLPSHLPLKPNFMVTASTVSPPLAPALASPPAPAPSSALTSSPSFTHPPAFTPGGAVSAGAATEPA